MYKGNELKEEYMKYLEGKSWDMDTLWDWLTRKINSVSVPAETLVMTEIADVEELTKTYNDSLDRLKKEYELKMKTLCRKQKEICANSAKAYIDKNGNAIVKNTSILNAESAWKDDSKQSV